MKARLVQQTIVERQDFTRGGSPTEGMGVGLRRKIREWLDLMGIIGYVINDDLTIDVNGDVYLDEEKLSEFPFYVRFGTVKGYFSCSENRLVSLRGCPKTVDGSFYCDNNMLSSLDGCPGTVKKDFYCNDNEKKFTEEEVGKLCKVGRQIYLR